MVWGFCVYFVYMIPLETDVLRKHRFQKSRKLSIRCWVIIYQNLVLALDLTVQDPKHTGPRPPDKSAYWKIIFFIYHPKHMLWVLKRTVSMRRFFLAPKTHV